MRVYHKIPYPYRGVRHYVADVLGPERF